MYAIYAFCRAVDDIADDVGPREPRRAALARWRGDIDRLYQGRSRRRQSRLPDRSSSSALSARGLSGRHRRHGDGSRRRPSARLTGQPSTSTATGSRARSAASRCASSASGRETGDQLAHHLGRALQLTNILRDLDEDAAIGTPLSAARGAAERRDHARRPPAGRGAAGATHRSRPAARSRRAPPSISPRRATSWRAVRAAPCAPRV